ncbi:MAG: hypothetical protein IKA62_06400 [Clostridia bacterium]|nr:hypothetical protein [Clostridia bacterium]
MIPPVNKPMESSLIAENADQIKAVEAMDEENIAPVGTEQIKKFMQILRKYKTGKSRTEQRIVASENWWKLRNTTEEQKTTAIGKDGGFTSKSAWLHNVIVSKHADAMEAYPEPNILPRELSDRAEARRLSAIVPCILEQNKFKNTYSTAMWQKMKTGTCVYKVIWDAKKLNGLGDISVECVNLLNLYWEPGVTDIQKSRYFFHTELCDKDILEQRYPDKIKNGLKGQTFTSTKFLYDDHVDTENKITVVEVYYHKYVQGKNTLQYCKFVNDIVLYATENEVSPAVNELGEVIAPPMAMVGLYDHGKYPYVFDALYPVEGSPCGYGYVDLCNNPQTEIDLMKTSFIKSAMVGSTPRYLSRGDSGINEAEFLDLSKPIVKANGVGEDTLKPIVFSPLDGNYINVLDRTIQELRETSGNTETSTGNISSGVTAASAIAALQEASGKGSRDSTEMSYESYSQVVEMCIELIRQFYSMPRSFRILGQYGTEQYISYTNKGLQMKHQGTDFGADQGFRLPVFDITISAQKKNVYTKVAQNELSLQFFKSGFFDPRLADQVLLCLEIMDFDGKDEIMQKISKNATLYKRLLQYMELALALAQVARPDIVEQIAQDYMQTIGREGAPSGSGNVQMPQSDNIAGLNKNEPKIVENSRARAAEASQPNSAKGGKK